MTIETKNLHIRTVHQSLSAGDFSVRELVDAYRIHIEKENPIVHAYDHLFSDIDDQVERAQLMYDSGTATLLTGIPIAVKANIQVKGQVCNASSKMLEHYVAVYDATAIARLRTAGVIFLGSTNMDEFAMGSSTENSAFGVTKNPYDTDRVPGGSSGGSAAAVASGMALAALGTDTGGSIRQPASFCNLVGFKGSYGSVSRYGAAAMGSSLDQIGPLATSVDDAQIIWECMRGQDEYDMTSLPDDTWKDTPTRKTYSFAIPAHFLEGIDSQVSSVFNSAVNALRAAGHTVEEVAIDSLQFALPVYYIVMPAEVSSNMARFDGIRYGFKASNTTGLLDEYVQTRSQGFGSEVKRRIILGTYILSTGYSDQYYTRALALREKMKSQLHDIFEMYDAIITPTSPVMPFTIGEKTNDPLAMYLADIYTVGANIAGIPAVSVPGGLTPDNLPVGVQFLGKKCNDHLVLDVAKQFESLV